MVGSDTLSPTSTNKFSKPPGAKITNIFANWFVLFLKLWITFGGILRKVPVVQLSLFDLQ